MSGSAFLRYLAVGLAALVIVGGSVYLLQRAMAPTAAPGTPSTASNAAKPPPASDDQAPPTIAQNDQLLSLVGEARRLAADGKFDDAEATLQKADRVYAGWPETERARSEIVQLRTPEGQLKTQLERARLAIEHDDKSGAEKALAEAERLNPRAPQIAELRQELQQAEQKEMHRSNRVTGLLTKMREEIARGDFAAADSDLNAAERIDVADPAVRDARRELARARAAKQKEQGKN